MPHPKKSHTFGLYSTSKQSHMKVGSKNWRLGMGLIKTLINLPSFELGLMVRPKMRLCDTVKQFSRLFLWQICLICPVWYVGNFFVRQKTVFGDVTVTCRNYHLRVNQPVPIRVLSSLGLGTSIRPIVGQFGENPPFWQSSRDHVGNPVATNLLDDMSDDALTGFGLGTDGLGARSGRLLGFQKSWWS